MNTIKNRKSIRTKSAGRGAQDYRRKRNGRKPAVSTIDPAMLVKKAVNTTVKPAFEASRTFDEMPININLKANLAGRGFKKPTQIQDETLEHLLEGKDLIGVANTGTGKTGAFLIPVIDQLLRSSKPFITLVVVPTRELALQVDVEFKALAKGLGLYSACFIGGTSVGKDMAQLRRKNHIIIGTPGRLLDLYDRGGFRIQDISTLILDEFDRMLDMGFKQDIQKMVGLIHNRKQTMLFSATIDASQADLIHRIVQDPIEVKVSSGMATNDQIDQDVIHVPQGADKFDLLLDMMSGTDFEKVLIFTETKRLADRVSKRLNASGVHSDQIHGNKSQNYRNNALKKFKKGTVRVLVATDVAARGIDVSDVSHVINYQLPLSLDSYIHRIGRTGRAGKPGKAFTFVDSQ